MDTHGHVWVARAEPMSEVKGYMCMDTCGWRGPCRGEVCACPAEKDQL